MTTKQNNSKTKRSVSAPRVDREVRLSANRAMIAQEFDHSIRFAGD